jgi:DNA-binding MarR family transcriptional regulator
MPVKFVFNNQLLGAWMLFHQTYNSISRCEDKEFGKLGISAQQHAILMAITRADGPVTPGQIARWVDRNANSITLILDRMEKSGLVIRTKHVTDRRSLNIEMTEKGAEVLRQGVEVGWKIIQGILGGLSAEEIEALSDSLEKLRRRAILRCYPETTVEEINIDEQHHLPQITKRGVDKK